eukprot:g40100.t1
MLDQLKQRCKEGNVPLSHPLVNFLKGAEKNKQILPDTRFENLQLLQSIDCEHQWVVTTSLCACEIKRRDERKGTDVSVRECDRGGSCLKKTHQRHIKVEVYGEHSDRCKQLAADYKIPQTLTPRMREWV